MPVAGIVGSSPEKSKTAAERRDLPRGYESFDELLWGDLGSAVHLTTPNRFHFEQAAAALRAEKHVLCEKPLGMTSAESADLVRIARESGRAAGVAYNHPLLPALPRSGRSRSRQHDRRCAACRRLVRAGLAAVRHRFQLACAVRRRRRETLIRDPSLLRESARGTTSYPGGHNEGPSPCGLEPMGSSNSRRLSFWTGSPNSSRRRGSIGTATTGYSRRTTSS